MTTHTTAARAHTQSRRRDARFVKIVLTIGTLLIALAASAAAASSFAINQSNAAQMDDHDIAEGAALVSSCDENVELDVESTTFIDGGGVGNGFFRVDKLIVQAGGGGTACDGWTLKAVLTDDGGASLGMSGVIDLTGNGYVEIDVSGLGVAVGDLHDVHLLLDEPNGPDGDEYEGGPGGPGGQGGQGGQNGGPSCTTHPEQPNCDPNKEGGQGGEDGEGGPGGGPSCTTHPEHPHCDPNK